MTVRITRILLAALFLGLAVPAAGSGAPRMWMGFQDDPYFRWKPERHWARDRAMQAGSTVFRTTVFWYDIARTRPANAANPFDPAYRLDDVDEFVRQAQFRGVETMIAIWGTPAWANGGKGHNYAPARMSDLTNFARALASRYSGRYPGYPFVRFWSVWNEPNLQLFLMPQFDRKGKSVGPALYAKIYRAGYAGIKAGNPSALVGIGDTSARGRDRRKAGISDSHSPGRFAELVAKARPKVKFDAWAHHPYPAVSNLPPTAPGRWPNISLSMIPRLATALDKWFGRKNTPIWITEYGHETKPEEPRGVTYDEQAAYMRQAVSMMRRQPRVHMFIWFVLRDAPGEGPWESGMLTQFGLEKPAFDEFSILARLVDARNPIVTVKGGKANPVLRYSALKFAYASGIGTQVGMTVRVFERGLLLAVQQPHSVVDRDGWVTIRAPFTPKAKHTYLVTVRAGDISGNYVDRSITVIAKK